MTATQEAKAYLNGGDLAAAQSFLVSATITDDVKAEINRIAFKRWLGKRRSNRIYNKSLK